MLSQFLCQTEIKSPLTGHHSFVFTDISDVKMVSHLGCVGNIPMSTEKNEKFTATFLISMVESPDPPMVCLVSIYINPLFLKALISLTLEAKGSFSI